MSSDVIRNWDKILHKNVRSKDMDGVGNVVAINDDDSISITTQGSQHIYKISKSHIEGYNGAEVFLNLSAADMSKYDINSKSQDNREDTITTTISTTASTKSVTETLSTPTLPRTQVKTSTSITEKRTESPTTDLASSHRPVITDNKSSSPTSNEALKAKRREAEDKARREDEDKARREDEVIEHATITTTKESFETPPTPPPQQQDIIEEKNLTTSTENTNNYLRNDKDPLAANMTLWQYHTVAWIDMYKQLL
jgi:hypothetical protein